MNQRTFSEEFNYQFKHGGMHIRLLIINLIVFVGIGLISVFGRLSGHEIETKLILDQIFAFDTNPYSFLYRPWGLFTSIFAHFGFFHFLSNMVFLYFAGQMFLQFFTNRRLLHVYIVGGLTGGLFEFLSHLVFPGLGGGSVVIVGASGSVMAIFLALAFYRPHLEVNLFGILPVKLFVIAGIYLLLDLVSLGSKDGVAHFAHVGGAFIGFLAVRNMESSGNIINMSETLGQRLSRFFENLFQPKNKLKVKKGGRAVKTDEEYALDKKQRQEKTDKILDKISKSGYESLTKAEKEFLFSQSKNG